MTITKAEYYQLVGLLALAERYYSKLEDIEAAALEITKEYDRLCGGHTSDAVYDEGRRDADELLKRLGIEVQE